MSLLREIRRRLSLRRFVKRIRKHGWTGLHIEAPEDPDNVAFSYSVGFWESVDAPEVIMFGWDMEAGVRLLTVAYEQLKSGELLLADEAPWRLDWEDGPALKWRKVHPSQIRREHFNIAIWYRERQGKSRWDMEAYQLFVSDEGLKFPWEEGYDTTYRPVQKELHLPYFGPPDED